MTTKEKPKATMSDAFGAWLVTASLVVLVAGVCFVSGNQLFGAIGYLLVVGFLLLMYFWVKRLPTRPTDISRRIRNDHV